MPKQKNPNQEENLTSRLSIRMSPNDMRNFDNLSEKECLDKSSLARRIILLYIKQQILSGE